ncbi:MAG: amidohydrolase family protein, partial [Cyclobacteriaceae bacterium]|nr:amidohydrolase family protein [Cyclobacteriaceae bacterium]
MSNDSRKITEVNASALPLHKGTKVITGATLIDGNGGVPLDDAVIVIQDNAIQAVGALGSVEIPSGAEVTEAKGLYLLPGLIDAHFHYDLVEGLPSAFLQNGITSVRDPGEWIEVYEPEMNGSEPLPRLFLSGPHLDVFPPAYPEDAYIVRDEEEVKRAVEILAGSGVTVIKVYFRMPLGFIKQACETADQYNLPVTAHLEITDAREAIIAGIDGVEHVTSFGTTLQPMMEAEQYRQKILADGSNRRVGRYNTWSSLDLNSAPTDSLMQFLVTHGTFVTPTLAAFEYIPSDDAYDTIKVKAFENMKKFVSKAADSGVKIVVGSHGVVSYAEKGWAFQHEMKLLVESGMPNME